MALIACESDGKLKDTTSGKEKQGIHVNRNSDFLPPMEIAIDPAIENDPELVDIVHSSEKAINQFSDNIERLADDAKVLLEKKEGEQSLGDGLRVAKIMMTLVSRSSEISKTIKKYQTYIESRKEQGTITDEQIEALDEVGNAFSKRMEELGKKYEYLLNQQK